MKKLLFVAVLFVCNYRMHAQMLTINNNTTCSVTFAVITSDPGTCDATYNSANVNVSAGASLNYSNISSLSWPLPAPPPNASWSGIIILHDGQMKFAGDECASLPTTISYTASCNGNTVNVNWTNNGGGNATVDIN